MGAMLPHASHHADPAARLESLRRIALVVAGPADETLVERLVTELAQALPVTTAFVATFADDARTRLRTLAAWFDGRRLPDFDYEVAGSPCERVVGQEFRYLASGVLADIDPASVFAEAKLDAYAAFPLNDSHGVPLGVLAVMDREPIAGGDAAHAEVMLKVVAGRLASELERRHTLDVLQRAALAVSAAQGDAVFDELVRMLATLLQLEFAFIARDDPDDPAYLKLLALHADGRIVHDLRYPVATSPCRHVLGQQFRAFPSGLAHLFPDDPDVLVKGAEGYAGHPLTGHGGEALGVIAVGSRQPLRDLGRIEAMLKIFAVRAAAELQRLRAVEALERSEASYRAIFDAAEDAIYVHDWDSFALLDVNPRACADHGRTREELLRADPAELTADEPPYDLEHALANLQLARLGRCEPFEWLAQTRRGRVWWEMHLKPAQIGGRPHILAFARDITERKAAEERLRASEAQYRAIFDASADALILWDSRFRRVDVNPAYEKIYGRTRDEVIGRGYEHLPYSEDYARPRRELVRRALAGETCRTELQAMRKDGTRIMTEVHTIPFTHRGEPHVLAIARDITERKAAEERLRLSEEQYRAIFNVTSDALALWDSQMRRVDVNVAYERLYGWTRDEVVGRSFGLIPNSPQFAQPREALMRRALAGETCVAELEAVHKNGERILTELVTIPFQNRGEPHVLTIARDITERRRAEAKHRAQEERYRAIFDGSVDPMVLWNERLEVADVNRAFEEVTGFGREQMIGRHWSERGDARDMQRLLPLVRAALAGQASHTIDRVTHADGHAFDMEIRYLPVRLGDEAHALGVGRNVTERLERERELARSEARLRATVGAAFDCVIGMDGAGRIVEFNPAAERVFGHRRDDVLGRELAEVILPERQRAAHRGALARFRPGAGGPMLDRLVETSALTADGREIPVEMAISVASVPEGSIFVGYLRDISARRAAEAERTQLEAQLRQAQKMEAIGQLTGGIAHDFNNMLTSVLGYTVLAQERAQALGEPRLLRQIGQARLATERARDLIAQMLAFARRKPGARRPLALAPLVRQAIELLRPTLPSSVMIDVEADEAALPLVDADAVQLEQVLFNLCINARDALAGAGHIRVGLHAATGGWRCQSCGLLVPQGRWVELCVEDEGSGIAPDTVRRMFDPFFTTKPAGSGSGMGLAMVHGIVHDHGGHIAVRTQIGAGTAFSLLLPAGAPTAQPPAVAGGLDARRAAGARPTLQGRVLLVEDDALAGGYLAEQLDAWGLDVAVQRDPRDALAWIEDGANGLDLLITDLTMPHLSGLQLAQRAIGLRPGLPVLLISGDLAAADPHALASAGIRATLAKPIDAQALRSAVTDALAPAR